MSDLPAAAAIAAGVAVIVVTWVLSKARAADQTNIDELRRILNDQSATLAAIRAAQGCPHCHRRET